MLVTLTGQRVNRRSIPSIQFVLGRVYCKITKMDIYVLCKESVGEGDWVGWGSLVPRPSTAKQLQSNGRIWVAVTIRGRKPWAGSSWGKNDESIRFSVMAQTFIKSFFLFTLFAETIQIIFLFPSQCSEGVVLTSRQFKERQLCARQKAVTQFIVQFHLDPLF